MREIKIAAGFIAATLALAGCGKSNAGETAQAAQTTLAAIKPGEEETLMPLTEGSQWTYVVERQLTVAQGEQRNSYLLTYRVVKSEKTPEGTKATLETVVGGKVQNRQVLLMKKDGLWQLAGGLDLKPYPNPQLQIPFPPDANRKFEWKGPGMITAKKEGTLKMTGLVLGPMKVDSDAGSFPAIAIEQDVEPAEPPVTFKRKTHTWYAPNVGLVRMWDERAEKSGAMTFTLKLKTYSLKK